MHHLQGLDISFCKELESATPTTGLVGLKVLNMRGCEALKQLPPGLGQLTNLQRLDLRACTGLKYGCSSLHLPNHFWAFLCGDWFEEDPGQPCLYVCVPIVYI